MVTGETSVHAVAYFSCCNNSMNVMMIGHQYISFIRDKNYYKSPHC